MISTVGRYGHLFKRSVYTSDIPLINFSMLHQSKLYSLMHWVDANKNVLPTGLDIEFLGTSSSRATFTRNVSCLCVNFRIRNIEKGGSFMFDCGEGTTRQLLKSQTKIGDLRAVFITHLHGDHFYGLPGLGMSTNVYPTLPKLFAPWQLIKIFTGAMGLRGFDLHGIIPPTKPHHHTSKPTHSTSAKVELHRSSHFAECHWDEREKCYKLFEDEKFTVKAVPIKHSIFCLGYVMQEKSKKGNLKVDVLKSLGLSPSPLYKQLQMGQDITWNGQVIKAADVTEPSQEGRKIVILGDTCDPSAITELAMDADVLIHEATCTNEELNRALLHHHSTAGMAGDFARRIRAKNLILTHFSPSKFHSNEFDECVAIRKLVDQAKTAFGSSSVFPAHVKHWIFCFGDDLGLLEISCAHGHRKGGHGKDTIT